jgi:hypothetical protein
MREAAGADTKMAYGVPELAERNDLSQAFVRAEIKAGRLPIRRAGRRVLVLAKDWQDYVAAFWPRDSTASTRKKAGESDRHNPDRGG